MNATVGRDVCGWFERMCAEKGLAPADPKRAAELAVGDVLFTVTGDPRKIKSVRRFRSRVLIKYENDPWEDSFPLDYSISLIATLRR